LLLEGEAEARQSLRLWGYSYQGVEKNYLILVLSQTGQQSYTTLKSKIEQRKKIATETAIRKERENAGKGPKRCSAAKVID